MRSQKNIPLRHLQLLLLPIFLLSNRTPTVAYTFEKDALLKFKSAVGKDVLSWEDNGQGFLTDEHCSWYGVSCMAIGIYGRHYVSALVLPNANLVGIIPDDVFLDLGQLSTLNLGHNNLYGLLPNVKYLLKVLLLENNSFTGEIPADWEFLSLDKFNVSYNKLTGYVPTSLRSMTPESFLGMPLSGIPWSPPPPQPPSVKTRVIVAIIVGFIILVLVIGYCCCRKDMANNRAQVAQGIGLSTVPNTHVAMTPMLEGNSGSRKAIIFFSGTVQYDIENLLSSSAVLLGTGKFGASYKVSLDIETVFVVKILKGVDISETEFKRTIDVIRVMEHRNLMSLSGYYFSKDEKFLLYDYMPKGNLSMLIHENRESERTPLDWGTRIRIAYGMACGIGYIHSTRPATTHGNIKSSNILLDESQGVHVSEQCITQLIRQKKTSDQMGSYLAPEVIDSCEFSQMADVYSFGVVLLELVTGNAPHQVIEDKHMDLPGWVRSVDHKEWLIEVFDLELLDYPDAYVEIVKLLDLAMECVSHCREERPTIFEIMARIERIQ